MKEVFENFEIYYEDHKEYLYAFVSEKEDSLEISLDFWNKVFAKCEELNHKKFLIEEKFDNSVSVADMNKFGELVTQNRGAHAKLCNTIESAEDWLKL